MITGRHDDCVDIFVIDKLSQIRVLFPVGVVVLLRIGRFAGVWIANPSRISSLAMP
jgi:hypothetical protein